MDEINDLIKALKNPSIQKEQNIILLQPFQHYSKIPFNPVPVKLCEAFNHWLNVPKDKFQLIYEINSDMYTAGVMLDDVLDNSRYREGVPVSTYIYGSSRTIKAAHFIIYSAVEKLNSLNNIEAIKIFTEQIQQQSCGEIIASYWKDISKIPSEFEYKLSAILKTGGFTLLSLRLLQLFSTNREDFSKLNTILAICFQIWNDYSDLNVTEYTGQTNFCRDIAEGNLSFPIIHAIRKEAPNTEILNILLKRTDDVVVKKYCLDLIQKYGSLDYTRKVMESLKSLALQEMARLGPNPIMDDLLGELFTKLF